ncbi:MAG: SMP-30/gluconolactonase/LRE family protein [Gammaproteobacteria bacterium]|nr:SMP-30/gluconolactonase/LRE family protein [Gammaproteobacteria bacterium]MDE0192748.1 SMP-30/gluconolactonase/LRE family protein [Gammaproteobacteria bacterium]
MERLAHGYGLVEGPVWVPGRGLMFSDVHGGGVYCLSANGAVATVFPHRRGIGGIALHADNGLVVGGRNIAFKCFDGGDTVVILDRDPEHGNVGFNDLTTDAAGRIYVGSLGSPVFEEGEQLPGNLHVIDLDGSARIVAEDVLLTNGLGFSPDGKTLYHSDSRRQTVHCYDVHANGDLGPKGTFATLDDGAPDGLAVSADGAVWVAVAGGGCVAVFEPDGSVRQRIAVPMPMCTSVCFGGEDLTDLYIVTGSDGVERDREGSIYREGVRVAGLRVPFARVPLNTRA